ncbi:MAG: hypothetical protein ACFFE8_14245 [Candidatus Heimdallarchaeota archaeon]
MKEVVSSPKIVLLDFFKTMEKSVMAVLNSPMIKKFCDSIADMVIVFSDITKIEEVISYIKTESGLPSEEMGNLVDFFHVPFQSSFSYGYKEKEFVFVRLEESSRLLKAKNRSSFRGLLLHEILHSIQRQRGMEIRLRNSLVFSLDFFTQLAGIVPPGSFEKEEIITFLKAISQFALYALKDIYVNVEMMKRGGGLGKALIDFYKADLHFGTSIDIPEFDTSFQKGRVTIKDLESFTKAFNLLLSLIPSWLPQMVLNPSSRDYSSARELKHFIFENYYSTLTLITRELYHIENIFLSSFSYSRGFHLKWFGAVFNLALEYLLGEDFAFYHLSKVTELIEEIYHKKEERRGFAMSPILKAAYVHKISVESVGIQQMNIEALDAMMESYAIDKTEIAELEESLEESIRDDKLHSGHLFERLLQLSIMILSQDYRQHVLHGRRNKIRLYGRAILTILQALNYLGDQCDEQYYHHVRLAVKQILRNTNNLFVQARALVLLERFAKNTIHTSPNDPTEEEVDELLFNLDFFEIPVSNTFVELGLSFINSIKTILHRVALDDPEFPALVSQFTQILLQEKRLSSDEFDQVNMVLVASLIATDGVPFIKIQPVVEQFVSLGMRPLNQEVDDTEENGTDKVNE